MAIAIVVLFAKAILADATTEALPAVEEILAEVLKLVEAQVEKVQVEVEQAAVVEQAAGAKAHHM